MRQNVLFLLPLTFALALAQPASALPVPLGQEELRFSEAAAQAKAGLAMPQLVSRVAHSFIGRPYLSNTLNEVEAAWQPGTPEPLVARLDAFDCVTLVESSLAVARAVATRKNTYAGYKEELERLRYRHGTRGGYASRLHYFSEWVADNEARGLLKNMTPSLGGQVDARPIRFMSAHRGSYRKLADDRVFAEIQAVEAHLNSQPRFTIPNAKVAGILPLLQSGDIIAFATDIEGLDVVHTGLLVRLSNGAVHLLHAPEPGEKVMISRKTLVEYLQQFPRHVGIIIARPLEAKS